MDEINLKLIRLLCCLGTLLAVQPDFATAGYESHYIQNPCQQERILNIGQDGSSRYGFITANGDNCYEPNKNCWITLNANSSYHVTIRFQWMSIDPPDTLYIIGETGSTPFNGYYTPGGSIYSTGNWLKLNFYTDYEHHSCLGGFRIYYTSYHTNECADNEFQCAFEGRCIPNELKCDYYDNCGDWSDEKSGTCGLSSGAIAAISVTCALVGISCIALLFYCLYDRAHRRNAGARMGNSNPSRNTTEPITVTEPIGPPKYTDAPPPYVYNNTVYAGVYEEMDANTSIPPAYQSFATTPYDNHHHHQSFTGYDNSNSHANTTTTNYNINNTSSSHAYDHNINHS